MRYYNETAFEAKKRENNEIRGAMPSLIDKDPDGILNFDILKCSIDLKGEKEFKILVEGAKRQFHFKAPRPQEAKRWY